MIFNLYVAVVLAIALFAIIVGSYTAFKAYKIGEQEKAAGLDERYELEKDYYLVSTVGWVTLASRIIAIPLFFITVISLIPSVPGAMCEFGVFQAGAPYSWVDFGLKLITVFAFGGWLFIDHINKKSKGAPLMGSLSRGFILLMPLLYLDTFLDLIFFGSLKPLVVPCCMVVYTPNSIISCPFCLVTYEMPLLMIAIPAFIIAVALMIWIGVSRHFIAKHDMKEATRGTVYRALLSSVALTLIGLLLVAIQVYLIS